MRTMLEVVAFGMLLTMGVVQVLMWRVATGRPTAGLTLLPLFAVLITPVALIWLSRVQHAVEAQEKRWRAEQPTAA
jgi:multisubunit Na+/H+ antiporter MnhG subunit